MTISYAETFDLGSQVADLGLALDLAARLDSALDGPWGYGIRSEIERDVTEMLREHGVDAETGEWLGDWSAAEIVAAILAPVCTLVNLCDHATCLVAAGGRVLTLARPAVPARVVFVSDVPIGVLDIDGGSVHVFRTRPSTEVTGLPDPTPGVGYVVSRLVYDACPDRRDLFVPHRVQRTPAGQPREAHALAQPAR